MGYHPQVILAERHINDGMGAYVAGQMVKVMLRWRIQVNGARVLVLGLAFKENCPYLHNTKVIDIIAELNEYGIRVDVYDPWIDSREAEREYSLRPVSLAPQSRYDGVILAVAHREFDDLGPEGVRAFGRPEHVLYDLKHILPLDASDLRL